MRGIVFDIKRFAIHDGPGIRTTVFLQGCPLDCQWCHNPESRDMSGSEGSSTDQVRPMSVDEILAVVERDRLYYDESGGGLTVSGGEPLAQSEFLLSLLKAARERELRTAVDTCGHAPWSELASIIPVTNLFLYDLKHMIDVHHRAWTGVSNELILENLRRLDQAGARIWVRIPAISGVTDNPENLDALVSFCRNLDAVQQIHVLPYHPGGTSKRKRYGLNPSTREPQAMPADMLERTVARLRHAGKPVYTGG